MNMTEETFCKTICSSEFICDWTKWNNPFDHEFPDGTKQTCVGAQVRCACTTVMNLISYVTYEHPTAVVALFFISATLVLVMIVQCIMIEKCCDLWCCCEQIQATSKWEGCSCAARNSATIHAEVGEASGNFGTEQNSIEIANTEKPPSYACVMMQEIDSLPPSYNDCMQKCPN